MTATDPQMRLLIIEDDRESADYLVKAFREVGYVADLAGDAHSLAGPQIVALYRASRDLVYALSVQAAVLQGGGTPTWPEQVAAI